MTKEKVFVSSSLEVLADNLEGLLFAKNSFWEKKIIVIPNLEIKEWLLKRMVQKNKAVLGFDFIESSALGSFFSKWLFRTSKNSEQSSTLPSFLELKLSLEKALREQEIEELQAYLAKGTKKKAAFLEELTHLFLLYGLYLGKWEGWQKKLFTETGWSTPLKEFQKIFSFDQQANFYFFGLPYLPPLFRDVIRKLAKEKPVFHFCFSPCSFFWEDQISDKEQKNLRRLFKDKGDNFLEWEKYLKKQNPLLANFGRLLRENLKILEIDELDSREDFSQITKNSFLNTVQADLIALKEADTNLITVDKDQSSLQIHEAPSKLREVEILKEEILHLLAQKDLNLSEIAVYAPQIEEYVPYIKMVFEGSLPCKFLDSEETSFQQGFFSFLRLMEGPFLKEDLFELLKNPAFQAAHRYKKEDVKIWSEWCDDLNVNFGLDAEQIEKTIGLKWPYQSFHYALSRLALSFALGISTQDVFPPLPGLTMSDTETLEKFLIIFKELEKDYRFLQNKPELSLKGWSDYLETWAQTHLKIENASSEEAVWLSFKKFMTKLRLARVEGNFALQSFLSDLKKELLKKKTAIGFSEIEVLQFSSLKTAVAPKKVICLLGLGEVFPSKEKLPSFSLLEKTYLPLKGDEDRFSFLLSLMSASQSFYLSYVNLSEEDGKKALPSSSLQELLRYLDSSYEMNGEKPSFWIKRAHAAMPFDQSYFSTDATKRSFSKEFYEAAQSYYGEKQSRLSLVPLIDEGMDESKIRKKEEKKEETQNDHENEKTLSPKTLPEEINLADLWLLARNPLQFHFQKNLKISLDRPKNKLFEMNGLDLYFLRDRALKEEIGEMLSLQEKRGHFPPSVMKEVLQKKIKKEAVGYLANLEKLGLKKEELITVELRKGQKELEKKDKHSYLLPPLELEFGNRKISLSGHLGQLSALGLMIHGKNDFATRLRAWPKILIFLKLNQKYQLFDEKLCFIKKATVANLKLGNLEEALSLYFRYYQSSLRSFNFLYKDWSFPLLQKDPAKLKKALKNNKNNNFVQEKDPYLEWLLTHSFLPEAESIVRVKGLFLEKLFQPFKEFEKTCKS